MALSFAACGGSNGGELKLGLIGPLTGPAAQFGLAVQNGINLYIKQLNAAGGIDGKQIDIIAYDDTHDPVESVNAYNRLVTSDEVLAILGPVTSGPTIAVAQESIADGTILVTPTATLPEITTYGDNIFRACFIDTVQGNTMAKFAKNDLSAKTSAVLFNADDSYSTGLRDSFTAMAEKLGITIVASEGYGANDVDFSAQLTNINSKNPDVLFLPYYYEKVYMIAQQAKAMGVSATLLGVDGSDGLLKIPGMDPAAVEGLYFSNHYSSESEDPILQQFLSDYNKEYGEKPNAFAALGYDAAKLLCEALKTAAANGVELKPGEELNSALKAALKNTDLDCVTGHITFDANNNPVKKAVIIKIAGGEYKYFASVE